MKGEGVEKKTDGGMKGRMEEDWMGGGEGSEKLWERLESDSVWAFCWAV